MVNVLGLVGIDRKLNVGNSWRGMSQFSGGFSSGVLCPIIQ